MKYEMNTYGAMLFLALIFSFVVASCSSTKIPDIKPEAPIKTSGKAVPPDVCKKLRQEGGKC